MKNLNFLTALVMLSVLVFTSCQDEIDNEIGDNPNTNSATSPTANNLEQVAMYDGSFDDFLDGMSCSSILLPVTATINGTQITVITQSDYQTVLEILGEFSTDDNSIQFQFPLTVQLSNYNEVQITNQAEFDALMDSCEQAEAQAESAINCLDIDFPISILTFNANSEQTGSVVIESEQQLYSYLNNLNDNVFFAVNYPITATVNGNSTVVITSDADLQFQINECLATEDAEDQAEENAENLKNILVEGLFKVDTFVNAGVDTASGYSEFAIDFANDFTVRAENTVNATVTDVQGTYQVASELEVFLSLSFSGNASFELLNNTWKVTSFSQSSIALVSSTNSAITLVLSQI